MDGDCLSGFSRTGLLLGKSAMERLYKSRVLVFGAGGVGGYVIEALARSGVGAMEIVDDDVVSVTNINRQILALHSTLGKSKAEAARERVLDINPGCDVSARKVFFTPQTVGEFKFGDFDYVVDCIDTVAGKIQIVMQAMEAEVPVISCMGAGNKIHPELFTLADISETSVCPLARVMRRELRKRGVEHLKVVYSKEPPVPLKIEDGDAAERKGKGFAPGSIAFGPSVAGLLMASCVIGELSGVM